MSRHVSFGIEMSLDIPWETLVERTCYVERLGFDSVWLSDQIMDVGVKESFWLEVWASLAGLSLKTSRIRLGTLVTHFNVRHPLLVARQALMVDQMSKGRLNLGIGAGTSMDFDLAGAGPWTPGELLERLREGLEILDPALRGEATSYTGEHFSVGRIVLPPSHQRPRPPITIAALGPKMIHLAAEWADAWNTTPCGMDAVEGRRYSAQESFELVRRRVGMLEQACADIGRDPDTIGRSLAAWPLFKPNCPLSSPSVCEDFVASYAELGFDEIIFHFPPAEQYPECPFDRDVFEDIATNVLPRLRSRPSRSL